MLPVYSGDTAFSSAVLIMRHCAGNRVEELICEVNEAALKRSSWTKNHSSHKRSPLVGSCTRAPVDVQAHSCRAHCSPVGVHAI